MSDNDDGSRRGTADDVVRHGIHTGRYAPGTTLHSAQLQPEWQAARNAYNATVAPEQQYLTSAERLLRARPSADHVLAYAISTGRYAPGTTRHQAQRRQDWEDAKNAYSATVPPEQRYLTSTQRRSGAVAGHTGTDRNRASFFARLPSSHPQQPGAAPGSTGPFGRPGGTPYQPTSGAFVYPPPPSAQRSRDSRRDPRTPSSLTGRLPRRPAAPSASRFAPSQCSRRQPRRGPRTPSTGVAGRLPRRTALPPARTRPARSSPRPNRQETPAGGQTPELRPPRHPNPARDSSVNGVTVWGSRGSVPAPGWCSSRDDAAGRRASPLS